MGLRSKVINSKIFIGIAGLAGIIAFVALFFYSEFYTVLAVALYILISNTYQYWVRRQVAKEDSASAPWRKKV